MGSGEQKKTAAGAAGYAYLYYYWCQDTVTVEMSDYRSRAASAPPIICTISRSALNTVLSTTPMK